jgi:uncharacterized protein YbjT (DUF2867 family)
MKIVVIGGTGLIGSRLVQKLRERATDGNTVRLPPALFQPMAADDVASAVARVAVAAPLNGVVEIAGPAPFRVDHA